MPVAARLARMESAFAKDGFAVKVHALKDDCIGALAEHGSARNRRTGEPKRAFCLQGDNYHMGWLMGFLAEPAVSRMCGEYLDGVAFAFFDETAASTPALAPLRTLLSRILTEAAERTLADIPREYLQEIDGLEAGCQAANPATRVKRDRLIALNVGLDCLLAHVYSGKLFAERGFAPHLLRAPIGCNAFILSGAAAGGRSFFGRDFMFPTAGVFQDVACPVVHLPDPLNGSRRHAFVSQTAPGIIGAMTAMNARGVAMGVNMLPSSLCDPARPGLNSLLLARDCAQYCSSTREVVTRVAATHRGVPWLYPVADAAGGGCVIEAVRSLAKGESLPDFSSIPPDWRSRLPGRAYVEEMRRKHGTPLPCAGIIARGLDYTYPRDYLADWNQGLWAAKKIDFPGASFGERGFLNERWTGRNCPGPFYFAPQRESRPDALVATNHGICPEVRMSAMNDWIALLAGVNQNDIQWRYDELNREVLEAIDAAPAGITESTAWELIDFLRPDGKFPDYYNRGGHPWQEVEVHGSVTLCELSGLTMKSRFGYYGDQTVSLHLGTYLSSG
jgi:hypothetical protein